MDTLIGVLESLMRPLNLKLCRPLYTLCYFYGTSIHLLDLCWLLFFDQVVYF